MKNIDNYKKNIPKEFMEKDQWLIFKKIPRKNPNGETKISKIPYSAITLSAKGWNERQNFASFDKALSVLVNNNFDGLSFVLTEEEPYACIDLDNCIKDGQISLFAKSIVKTFEGSYMELSASTEGIHIFMKANIPANLNQQNKGIEIYKMNRCIAMTGDIYSIHFEASTEVLDFDEELQKLYRSLTVMNKAKSEGNPRNRYRENMLGQTALPDTRTIIDTMCKVNPRARDYFYGTNLSGDWSRDDFIFLLLLRSFTHGNSHLMESIFLESALSRLGSKTKRKNDQAYLKYLRASIQKANQVGNSDFWNYDFKRLTQIEVSL
jgi:hypothetical protein